MKCFISFESYPVTASRSYSGSGTHMEIEDKLSFWMILLYSLSNNRIDCAKKKWPFQWGHSIREILEEYLALAESIRGLVSLQKN